MVLPFFGAAKMVMKLLLRGYVGVITIAVILAFFTSCSSEFQPAIPEMALGGMEPQVVAKITQLRDSVIAHPRNADWWGRLAMNLYVHELLAEAAQCFENASRLNPREFRWPYFCAIALHNLGRQESLEWYRKAVKIQPHEPQLHVRMANAYLTQGRYEDAAKHFTKALDLDQKMADAYLGLAQIDYNNKRYGEATVRLEKAISLQPNHRQAHALLISCYRMQWMQRKVVEASKRLLQLEGEESSADPILNEIAGEGVSFHWYMERGGQFLQAQQPVAAAAEFRRALAIRPEASAYSQLGVAMANWGKPDSAISYFRKARELNPMSALHNFNLGVALCNHGHASEGIMLLEQACQISPEEERYSSTLFDQYVSAGRWTEALQLGSQVHAAAPKNLGMGLKLAWLLATCPRDKLRNGAEAAKIAELIVQGMNSPSPEVLDCLAAAYAENGQYDLAATTIAQAIQIAESAGEQDKVSKFREREERYLQKRPWRSEHSYWR